MRKTKSENHKPPCMQIPAALGGLVILLVKVKASVSGNTCSTRTGEHYRASTFVPLSICCTAPPTILNSPFRALCSAHEARHREITFCSSPKRLALSPAFLTATSSERGTFFKKRKRTLPLGILSSWVSVQVCRSQTSPQTGGCFVFANTDR